MTTVAIVCGYDLHSDLRDYVRRVAAVIADERCDALVLSGGRTSPTIDDSEAQAMTRALAVHLPDSLVVLEERAMTTLDNIVYASQVAEQYFAVERYVVTCDRVHAPKVAALAALLLRRPFTVRAVPRRVPLTIILFEPISLVVEVIAAVVPILRSPLRRASMRLKGLSVAPSRRSAQQEVA